VSADEEAVIAANERYYAAFATRNLAAMDAAWARHTPATCIHPGWMLLEGREDVMASWASILGNETQPRVVPGGARAVVVGEMAMVHCREFVAGAGLVATNLFVREDGEWRIFHHHASPVLATR
jgi:ketosteroid isomerase-like protein